MARGTSAHNIIVLNIRESIAQQTKCFVFAENMQLMIQDYHACVYPDVVLTCEPITNKTSLIHSPSLIVEVISESTENYDRAGKFKRYQTLPSLLYYVLVSQTETYIEVFERQIDNAWLYHSFTSRMDTISFSQISLQLLLKDVYKQIDFEEVS